MPTSTKYDSHSCSESGNILIYILGAIFIMGLLIMAVRGSGGSGANIDEEKVMIKASQVQQYAAELERAVKYIMRNGYSESDIRFAHPDAAVAYGTISSTPGRQVFDKEGGGAEYRLPPSGINDGTYWQFYATTHIKDIGDDDSADMKAELIAVLPNVTSDFCDRINDLNEQDLTLTDNHDPTANGCIHTGTGNEFAGTFTSGASTNYLDDSFFSHLPPRQACVLCESDGELHFYHVLMGR
jgi:hypothetical protein